MAYRLSFEVETDRDPSELLDGLLDVVLESFPGTNPNSVTVEDLD
jgi:hypothetical protein